MLEYADFELLAVALLLVASIVAIAARYLHVPYTVALIVAGLGISFTGLVEVSLSHDLILLVFLPPLLFEGAINMDLRDLRRRWMQVGLLATVGTVVTAATVTAALWLFVGMLRVLGTQDGPQPCRIFCPKFQDQPFTSTAVVVGR